MRVFNRPLSRKSSSVCSSAKSFEIVRLQRVPLLKKGQSAFLRKTNTLARETRYCEIPNARTKGKTWRVNIFERDFIKRGSVYVCSVQLNMGKRARGRRLQVLYPLFFLRGVWTFAFLCVQKEDEIRVLLRGASLTNFFTSIRDDKNNRDNK